jgi:anti-sigma factor RsiW
MNHLSEEQLILHYYGEEGDALAAERHLGECEACRALYGSLQRTLNVVDSLPVPEPGAEYGERVWKRIEHRLPARRRARWLWALPARWRWAAAGAAGAAFAALLVAAFLAGRFYPHPRQPVQLAAADPQAGERILLVAVGDYLERSQMVLIELANARSPGSLDISAEQERAVDLVSENRLYRQTAGHTGDSAVASVLDELERVLLDITHAPSRLSPGELEKLRQRLEAEGILFKIRVLGSNVRNQEEKGSEAAPRAAGQKS